MVFKLRIKKRVVFSPGVLVLMLLIWPVITASSASSSVPEGLDRPPEFYEVRYSPEDGDRTATNPPAFVWVPEERAHYLYSYRSLRPFTQGMVTTALAWLYIGDKRFAEEARRRLMHFMTWDMEAKPPSDLPYSRAIYDVGLVAMHSDMPNPDNNILMLFKSNPFGALSHNHASQNAFVIEAFGEALALTSGARLNHGEAHHVEWIRHTKAHNSILVDHEGQTVRRREESSGRIIAYEETGDYTYTVGDATRAYGGKLERFHRHVLYLRPDVYVFFDDLKSSGELSMFQWLLHGPTTIDVDPERRVMVTRSGNARLISRHLYPEGLACEQHTGFTPEVVDPDPGPGRRTGDGRRHTDDQRL